MKLSVSAYRAHASAHKKILSSSYHSQLNYGSTGAAAASSSAGLYVTEPNESISAFSKEMNKQEYNSDTDVVSPTGTSSSGQEQTGAISKHGAVGKDDQSVHSSESKSASQRKSDIGDGGSDPESDWTRSNQRWMKLRTTVQISSAIQKKPPLKREDSFLKRFSTRQIPETQETVEDTGSESASGDHDKSIKRRRRYLQKRRSVVNPDENFYFYWLMMLTICILYNLWALIVRQSFPELQKSVPNFWFICDTLTDIVFIFDILVQLRTGYLEQGLMVYDDKKLACHYVHSGDFIFDIIALIPLDLLQLKLGTQPLLRFTRFFKVYRSVKFYYIVESRTVWPNLWRVVNLIHILLILAHWFGCFYYLLSEAEGFQGDWVYPYRPGDYATLTRKYLGSLYWSTLTLTTIGDLPTPETNAEYIFTIVSYLIGVFIFATIVGQVGNVITNRNANRLEFERLLDGAKTYMRHHKVPGGMKRRVLRWYDYSWSRGRIQGGGDINTALGLLPDKLKTELALHVNLSVLKKVTIFQECQPEFLHDLVLKMKAYIFTPGDSICRKGEVAREMFIIADGILEVLSETGKVLTTMKAGDFFGEIGILNLDGLNKRTADVRSVGYSELFSLSREDVLAAMKDYPEAQEILQTLGRKRLMEVRCVNKKYSKIQSEKEAAHQSHQHHSHHVHQSDSSENSASKKIVDKLKNDVRGFKNVLKKSRTPRKSIESLEMQPLHTSSSPKNNKSMLKRMSKVRSDEKDENAEEKEEQHDKTPSPIGAGLPLLQRLRLLKDKQDREERAVKSTPQQKTSPSHSHVTCTLSPQESIQEEPEKEINEGLPLIQRLQQLKIKNHAHLSEPKLVATSPIKLEVVPFLNGANSSHGNITPPQTLSQSKPVMKVSFKQKIQQIQSIGITDQSKNSGKHETEKPSNNIAAKKEPPKTLPLGEFISKESLTKRPKPIQTISNKIIKPSSSTSRASGAETTTIKPWSRLKLATLISSSYTSLTNCSAENIETTPKNSSMGSIPIVMTEDRASASAEYKNTSISKPVRNANTKKRLSPDTFANKTKFYKSVFDLSPEYNGLPFVKRLKILNERQKLAELEKVLQTRSFSLDSSKTNCTAPISDSLYRCYSDTSGIYSQFMSTYESSSTTSTNTSTSENSKKITTQHTLKSVPHYSPLSPESNETIERRKLKSILKKLHKSREQRDAHDSIDDIVTPCTQEQQKDLLRQPTLEGPPGSADFLCTPNERHFGIYVEDDNTQIAHPSNLPISTISNKHLHDPVTMDNITSSDTKCSNFIQSHSELRLESNQSNQKLLNDKKPHLEGFPEAQEYCNQVLYGINNVIKMHMNEMHLKFESQFASMSSEVKQRDAIIAHLESKLRNLELKAFHRESNREQVALPSAVDGREVRSKEENDSSGSSAELLFMRGDSLDTVFTSSPPTYDTRHCTSPSINFAPYHRYRNDINQYDNDKSTKGNVGPNHTVVVSDVTGNLTRLSDNVILDIGESSGSSSSSSKSNLHDDDDDTVEKNIGENDPIKNVHHNDWEVKMLAAELEKQERKRGHSLSGNLADLKQCGTALRRRRKFSDTESERSETDVDEVNVASIRPRASSLDQFNLRYGIGSGIFKAMSIDSDKDKL